MTGRIHLAGGERNSSGDPFSKPNHLPTGRVSVKRRRVFPGSYRAVIVRKRLTGPILPASVRHPAAEANVAAAQPLCYLWVQVGHLIQLAALLE